MADIYAGSYYSHYAERPDRRGLIPAYLLLLVFLGICAFIQSLPLVLPLGSMYWDVLLYYDAIGRMDAGQWPVTDFMVPVGPLEYWLAYLGYKLFPEAHPVLLTQLAWLPVTAPVMALIMWDAGSRSRAAAWGLLIPWMIFTLLPFNVVTYNNYAGTDAYGIYNRHGAHLMYLTAATVLFVRGRVLQTVLLSVLMLSLAFCKITAFAAVGPLLILGLLTRRIDWKVAVAVALVCIGLTGVLQLATGVVVAYVATIFELVSENTEALTARFLTAISLRFDILAAGALLCLVLFYREVISRDRPRDREGAGLAGWLDGDWVWLGLSLFCGLLFETQNTGSHPYLVVWPAVLRIVLRPAEAYSALRFTVYILLAFMVIPPVSTLLHKAARTTALAARYVPLDAPNLSPLGRVSTKDVYVEQAERMRSIYVTHPETFAEIAATEALPSFQLFSEFDYQWLLLAEMDRAAAAIAAWEGRTGQPFRTVLNLDFANPFPFILDKPGTPHVMIGADPSRSIPTPSVETLAAVAETDLILAPKCPFHHARLSIKEIYAPALEGRQRLPLTECYDVLLKPESPFVGSAIGVGR